jgi:hypothetical protein
MPAKAVRSKTWFEHCLLRCMLSAGREVKNGNSDLYLAIRKQKGIAPVSANFAKIRIISLKGESEEGYK